MRSRSDACSRTGRLRRPALAALAALACASGIGRAQEAPHERDRVDVLGDVRAGGEGVSGIPGRDDLERLRLRLRAGLRATGLHWEIEGSFYASLGSDDREDAVANRDNEPDDAAAIDRLAVRAFPAGTWAVAAGKAPLPLTLGPMVWDGDLRSWGIATDGAVPVRRFDELAIAGAWGHPDHPLVSGTRARLAAAQADWRIRPAAAAGGALTLSWLRFDELDDLVPAGLAWGNSVAGDRLATGFELADLQLVGRMPVGALGLTGIVDAVRNTDADRDGDGVQVIASIAPPAGRPGWEGGVSARRVQRDAVPAAYASDDWWLRTAHRGARGWVGRRWGRSVGVRVSATRERADGSDQDVYRWAIEFRAGLGR